MCFTDPEITADAKLQKTREKTPSEVTAGIRDWLAKTGVSVTSFAREVVKRSQGNIKLIERVQVCHPFHIEIQG